MGGRNSGSDLVRARGPIVGMMIGVSIVLLSGCTPQAVRTPSPESRSPAGDAALAVVRTAVEDIVHATAYRYGARDDRDHEMDGLKIIEGPQGEGFIGVSHAYIESTGTYYVHLATSQDLLHWTWRRQIASGASMPA